MAGQTRTIKIPSYLLLPLLLRSSYWIIMIGECRVIALLFALMLITVCVWTKMAHSEYVNTLVMEVQLPRLLQG